MNARMWRQPRVQANVAVLRGDGVHVVGPDEGWLAEAETGPGRMAEPAAILEAVRGLL
jgi:phosphopantothenoylcysteine decarboxylase/phosphopantothenate--cysteine ligase